MEGNGPLNGTAPLGKIVVGDGRAAGYTHAPFEIDEVHATGATGA